MRHRCLCTNKHNYSRLALMQLFLSGFDARNVKSLFPCTQNRVVFANMWCFQHFWGGFEIISAKADGANVSMST